MGKISFEKEYLKNVKGTTATVFVYRFVGIHLAWKLKNTKITPNQMTILSFLSGFLCALFFSIGSYGYFMFGALFYQISIIFDYSDGALARFKDLTSDLGVWIVVIVDALREFFVIFGLCLGLYSHTANSMVWVLGFILCGTNYMMDIQMLTFESFHFAEQGIKSFAAKSKLYKIGREFISVRTTRYLAINFFAIIDQMYIYLLVFCIYNIMVFALIALQLGSIVKAQEKRKSSTGKDSREEGNTNNSRTG